MEKEKIFKPTYDVGYKGVAVCGTEYCVIAYNGRKNITIKFSCGFTKNTTSTHIKQNKVKYNPPNIKVGDSRTSKYNGDIVSVIGLKGDQILCKWESDGSQKWTSRGVYRAGILKHPLANLVVPGDKFPTKLYGDVIVRKVDSATSIDVEFADGVVVNVSKKSLFDGYVRHPYSNLVVGPYFKTNSGFVGKILKYETCHSVVVRWEDGTVTNETANHISMGSIKPKTQKTVFNVGYVGYGKWVPPSVKVLEEGQQYIHPKIYKFWVRMLDRLYNPKTLMKRNCNRYLFAVASESFKCAQNFVEWAVNQPYWEESDAELDKDLLGDSLLYSETTCCFLPRCVNIFIADHYARKTSDLPKGVNFISPKTSNSKGGYIARCHNGSAREYLGFFDTPEEAFVVYKQYKEKVAKALAEKYKDKIHYKAYEALRNFTVE